MKKVVMALLGFAGLAAATLVFAGTGTDVGSIAGNITQSMGGLAKLITAGSYVGGLAFVVGAIVKFKAHKDNPTQIPIGTPIALLFVGSGLIFAPSVMSTMGSTIWGAQGGSTGKISGVTSFGGQ